MAAVKWLPEALADLRRLHEFLQSKDEDAAARAMGTILRGVQLLAGAPRIGRPMPDETGRRELFVPFGAGAYVLRYMLQDDMTVVVVRVWHNREDRL